MRSLIFGIYTNYYTYIWLSIYIRIVLYLDPILFTYILDILSRILFQTLFL